MASNVAILVVAAGRGSRVGTPVPKQYLSLAGASLLTHALANLARTDAQILVVINPQDLAHYDASVDALPALRARLLPPCSGGETRQDSVRYGLAALAALPARPDLVLIHDGARPFATPALVARAIAAAQQNGAAAPGLFVTDTIKEVDGSGRIVATPQRATLRAVQTPQAFRFDLIHAAHEAAAGRRCPRFDR